MSLIVDVFYLLALVLLGPILLWRMATQKKYRAGLLERLGFRVEPRVGTAPCFWVHGVSVGEVLATRPLVREIERALPGWDIVISSTTQAGVEIARKTFPGRRVIFYPLDLSFAVRRLLRAIRPSVIVLVELELWPNFLARAWREDIPVTLVNGRISERSYNAYRWLEPLLLRPLQRIRRFCVQTDEYARRFLALGVPPSQVLVTGNMKYDNLPGAGGGDRAAAADSPASGSAIADPDALQAVARAARAALDLAEGERVLLAGSTHAPEERTALGIYGRLAREYRDLRLVLAPRHTDRIAEVEAEVRAAGFRPVKKTEIDGVRKSGAGTGTGARPAGEVPRPEVIIVDTMGELAQLYAAAEVVFVGGSMVARGGQNMLEPAGIGRPVVFGPNVANFRESADLLLRANAAVQVKDEAGLEAALRSLLADREEAADLGRRARASIQAHRGAAMKNVEVLKSVVAEVAGAAASQALAVAQ